MRYDVKFQQKVNVNGKVKDGFITKTFFVKNSNELNNKINWFLPALGKSAKVIDIKKISIKETSLKIVGKEIER